MENTLTERMKVEQGTGTTVIILDAFNRIEYRCEHKLVLGSDSSATTFFPLASSPDWHLTRYYYSSSSSTTYHTRLQRRGALTSYNTLFPGTDPY